MQINILQRGGKKNHELIDKATRFFASKLMSTRMINTLAIRIEIRATKLGANVMGSVNTKVNGSDASKEFTIVLQRDMSLRDQLETIAHEMVHVWQKRTNKLQQRYWKSDGKLHVRWNGHELGVKSTIPYHERPWEKEAYKLEKPLLDSFRAFHKGHSDYLPKVDAFLKQEVRSVINSREATCEMGL